MPQVYFRYDHTTRDEFEVCSQFFPTVLYRTDLAKSDEPVICRYSALPFIVELEQDLKNMGLRPINSSNEHSYIAGMGWMYDIDHLTFPTWYELAHVPKFAYPLVIKGKTNSRKFEWSTKMFAEDLQKAIDISSELMQDPIIGPQGLVFRQYVPLKTFEIGINGMPMTNEWRCFFYKDKLVDYGFYWSSIDDLSVINEDHFVWSGLNLAKEAAGIISEFATFFVIDVAEGVDGKWWVVEVNDGQMSGLSTIPMERFYSNLKQALSMD